MSEQPRDEHHPQRVRRRPRILISVVAAVAIAAGALVGVGSVFGLGSEPTASAATHPFRTWGHRPGRHGRGSGAPSASASRTSPGTTGPGTTSPSAAGPGTSSPSTAAPVPTATGSGAAADVVTLVNSERAKAGCSALAVNAALTKAASDHSTDMATRNYFSHDTPEGVDFSARITAAGYAWSGAGENIAMGQANAASVMDSWMNSSGHRANILNCGYRDIGVGVAANGAGQLYWTQDFGSPR